MTSTLAKRAGSEEYGVSDALLFCTVLAWAVSTSVTYRGDRWTAKQRTRPSSHCELLCPAPEARSGERSWSPPLRTLVNTIRQCNAHRARAHAAAPHAIPRLQHTGGGALCPSSPSLKRARTCALFARVRRSLLLSLALL
jgi:hypothetical protein